MKYFVVFEMSRFPLNCPHLHQIPELSRSCVLMKNPEVVNELAEKFINAGRSHVQVVADFDQTLTKSHMNGKKCSSSFGVINWFEDMPQTYHTDQKELFGEYGPKIMSGAGGLSDKSKIPYIYEWFDKQIHIYSQYKMNKQTFPNMVRQSNAVMRDGTDLLFETLDEHGIPLVLVSAGLGDIQREILNQRAKVFPNMYMLANFFKYDEKGNVLGLTGDQVNIIHLFNKCEKAAERAKSCPEMQKRKNVLVLGDNVADHVMADSLDDPRCLLKVGFLNERVQERLNLYLEAFHIVIVEDQSVDVVNAIISKIIAS